MTAREFFKIMEKRYETFPEESMDSPLHLVIFHKEGDHTRISSFNEIAWVWEGEENPGLQIEVNKSRD